MSVRKLHPITYLTASTVLARRILMHPIVPHFRRHLLFSSSLINASRLIKTRTVIFPMYSKMGPDGIGLPGQSFCKWGQPRYARGPHWLVPKWGCLPKAEKLIWSGEETLDMFHLSGGPFHNFLNSQKISPRRVLLMSRSTVPGIRLQGLRDL